MTKNKTIIITCGGTGGHIFPAIEIAKFFKKQDSLDVLFVGALGRMEMDKVPKTGFKIIGIWIQGYYRKSIFRNLLFPLKLIISLIQSFFILRKHKPLAVIGTGGFASFPILYVASFLGIKTYIQEQNCYPGLANRILGKRVNRVFVAHTGLEKFFPKNKILNFGNPVRKSLKIDTVSKKESREFFGLKEDVFTILVIGGSLGAEAINKAIHSILCSSSELSFWINQEFKNGKNSEDYNKYMSFRERKLEDQVPEYIKLIKKLQMFGNNCQFIWQTGDKGGSSHSLRLYKEKFEFLVKDKPEDVFIEYISGIYHQNYCSVHKFIDRMDLAYQAADIVISRAGAIAISEICFLSKPSILIPSPHVTADHQTINAEYLVTNDACIVFPENHLNKEALVDDNSQDLSRFTYPSKSSLDPVGKFPIKLITAINDLKNKDKREQMGKNANKLFKYNTADEITSVILSDIKLV